MYVSECFMDGNKVLRGHLSEIEHGISTSMRNIEHYKASSIVVPRTERTLPPLQAPPRRAATKVKPAGILNGMPGGRRYEEQDV